ncbi:MAG TPA: TRAP transporter small permease [Candidatus Desulfovibrio intestinipullorum]|uniref:TRAP transporter small permease n=1 Tax=Candidatus Desulfovibrio intestinipullorum TaxID=2838536 RepID=A0A9D1TQ48_9BACT|nr:TRAP transporter small permease [Candidatus Desulfovibrio intestinipullorum]
MASDQEQSAGSTPSAAQPAQEKTSPGRFLFEIFCAVIFLGMIGLVTYNAFLRYAFRSSFPPSEEWARFLFIYVTFFGAIEAFYHHRHIAVDLVTDKLHGATRKAVDIIALLCSIGAMGLLLVGGIEYVRQTIDTYSVSTNINMSIINSSLPICAAVALVFFLKDLWKLLRTPASQVNPVKSKEEKIAEFMKDNM